MSARPARADAKGMDELPEAIEYAILREAVSGASRIELWLAVRSVSPFAAMDRFVDALDTLVARGHLMQTTRLWKTTRAGRARLDRAAAAR